MQNGTRFVTALEYCKLMGDDDKSAVCRGNGKLQDESLADMPMCFSVTCDPILQDQKRLAASGFLASNMGRPAAYVCPDASIHRCVYTGSARAVPPEFLQKQRPE